VLVLGPATDTSHYSSRAWLPGMYGVRHATILYGSPDALGRAGGCRLRGSSGSFAIFTAIRRASSFVRAWPPVAGRALPRNKQHGLIDKKVSL
jgi:hypothetical protein